MDRADNLNNSDDIFYRSEIMIGETILIEIMFWVVATYVSLELNKELHRDIFDGNNVSNNGVEK